jgi:AAA domain
MTLKTRKPTGTVPWPLILIEGEEKAGKTWSCAELTTSAKVGRCFWIDLGEGAADEYGAIPGARYEVVEHDGSFAALLANVTEIREIARQALEAGEKPVVLIIDTMTDEWDLLKDWATDRAKSSRANRAKLAKDPNAEIVVSGNYWNDANARHRKLMHILKRFPGIVLMTSHGKVVASIGQDGQPVEGKKEHKVEAQKTLGADASCWIRLFRTEPGVIVGGRSAHLQFRPGEAPKPLARDWTLEGIIFDVLKCDPATAHVRDLAERRPDAVTPEQIVDEALRTVTVADRVRDLFREAKRLGYDDVTIVNEMQNEELLLRFLHRVGLEKAQADEAIMTPAAPAGPRAVADAPDAKTAPAATEEEFVLDFMGRLNDAPEDQLGGMQAEVSRAMGTGIIRPATASELLTNVKHRKTEVRRAAAA